MFQQGDRSGIGAGANLKKHLGSLSAEELKREMENLFEEEAGTGKTVDPETVAVYYAAMEDMEHDDQTQAPGSFERSWATFVQNHPDLFPEEKKNPRNRNLSLRRAMEAAVLAAAILVLSAAAFNWPDHVMSWGKKMLHISPVETRSGVMELSQPNEDGYSTLAGAVAGLGPDEVSVPTWIPEAYAIKSISVQKLRAYNVATAIYTADASELVVRVVYYFDQATMPDWLYEDNGNGENRSIQEYQGQQYAIVDNFDRAQAMWKTGNCFYSISGNVSVEEMEWMVKSTYGG